MSKSRNENRMMRRRLANAYLSSVVSISLVLLLVGMAGFLLINTGSISDYFKENIHVSVIFKHDASDDAVADYLPELEKKRFVRQADMVTKDQGEKELAEMLGEDFLDVFEASPVPVSITLSLHPEYVVEDSLAAISALIEANPMVEEVSYQKNLVDALNTNLSKISAILGIFISLLVFISFVLIGNTMRLTVYAKRFTVHTMQLVGATKSFIRGPFLIKAAILGLVSSLVSLLLLGAILLYVKTEFVHLFNMFSIGNLLLVMGMVVLSGIVICVVSSYVTVSKLVSLSKDELYY